MPVIFINVNCTATFNTILSVSVYCNQRIHYLTSYTECTFCLLHSVIKTSSIILQLSLFKHECTIILYQEVSYACGYIFSNDSSTYWLCYEIMKHANRVNSVFCIEVFPIKMNITYKKRNIVHVGAMCVHK